MISKKEVDRLPTSVREDIKKHLMQELAAVDKIAKECAINYTLTADEKQRAASLTAQGAYGAYMDLYNVFK